MRILIPCAGQATRWGDGTNKHLVKLCGERVLHRTVRLIGEIASDAEVLLVVENHLDNDYRIDGSSRRKARLGSAVGDVDKIASSRHLWGDDDWTLVLFGDVWWSRPALELVLNGARQRWAAFGRFGPNGEGGEIFGFAFTRSDLPSVDQAVSVISERSGDLATAGHNGRPVRGGWALYRMLCGAEPDDHRNLGHFVTVNDWTEDLDSRRDWDSWCLRYAKSPAAKRVEQVGS